MADEALLDDLRAIARRDGISLAEVMRQAFELRIQQASAGPRFIGAGASGRRGHNTAASSADAPFKPRSWR